MGLSGFKSVRPKETQLLLLKQKKQTKGGYDQAMRMGLRDLQMKQAQALKLFKSFD